MKFYACLMFVAVLSACGKSKPSLNGLWLSEFCEKYPATETSLKDIYVFNKDSSFESYEVEYSDLECKTVQKVDPSDDNGKITYKIVEAKCSSEQGLDIYMEGMTRKLTFKFINNALLELAGFSTSDPDCVGDEDRDVGFTGEFPYKRIEKLPSIK